MAIPHITEYKMVWGETSAFLNDSVNEHIRQGWQPFQSPFAHNVPGVLFFQAMVKYSERL